MDQINGITALSPEDLQMVEGGSMTAAAVGAALLGVCCGALIGAAIVCGVYYLVQALK